MSLAKEAMLKTSSEVTPIRKGRAIVDMSKDPRILKAMKAAAESKKQKKIQDTSARLRALFAQHGTKLR